MRRHRKSLHRATPDDGTHGLEGEHLELHQVLSARLITSEGHEEMRGYAARSRTNRYLASPTPLTNLLTTPWYNCSWTY